MDKVFNDIKKVISQWLNIDPDKITMDTNLVTDIQADSLDYYELVYRLEEEENIEIPDEKVLEFKTVRDVHDFVMNQISK